jgi:hypothetical protein
MAPSKRSTSTASKTPPTKKLRISRSTSGKASSVLDHTSISGDSDNSASEEQVLVEDEDEDVDEEQPLGPLGGPIPSIFT